MRLINKEKLIVQLKERIAKAKKSDAEYAQVLQKLLEHVMGSGQQNSAI